jgi:CheY-like chemotaxis protein
MKKIEPGAKDTARPKSLPRLLYIEDNDDNWHVTQLRLGRSYELVRATTDRTACEILSRPGKFYAILMDIELGGSKLNGIQLTKLIRGTLPVEDQPDYARNVPLLEVPVLFVTAYGDAYPRSELLGCGADDVIGKPINFTRMSLALTNLYIKRVLVR